MRNVLHAAMTINRKHKLKHAFHILNKTEHAECQVTDSGHPTTLFPVL